MIGVGESRGSDLGDDDARPDAFTRFGTASIKPAKLLLRLDSREVKTSTPGCLAMDGDFPALGSREITRRTRPRNRPAGLGNPATSMPSPLRSSPRGSGGVCFFSRGASG